MSLPDPRLPDCFKGRAVPRETTPFLEACRLSRCQKTEPGDLFYSRRHGMASCALVLEADCTVAEAAQSVLYGQLAAAETLRALHAPSNLSLIWPFGTCLNGREVARTALGGITGQEEPDETADWLVLGVHIRISGKFIERLSAEQRMELTALQTEGMETDRTVLLERLAKELDRLGSEWLDGGFAAIRDAWAKYARTGERPVTRLDMDGNAIIEAGEGCQIVRLTEMIARQQPLHLAA
ncbi:biotin/lipoate--protein ligase family protein [Notoacmeibacter ruber]|uniref:BPL/LPL catalytic domain-containing protein n=1 Tax=Notoacmeibacter ruber TaxID=2670375 RepID=A0A3L7J9H3_9HYPH|nr:biotin/lipoate--protein ligase family protein [Notoacmeibacter ruber]RLQ87129.1 hypothetical protein D8780_01755 [Notoacmeibacter ruber]